MALIAQKLIACLTLLTMFWANANCLCAEAGGPDDVELRHADHHEGGHDGDHDQDHHDHGACQCVTNSIPPDTSSHNFKPTTPVPTLTLFDSGAICEFRTIPLVLNRDLKTLSVHPPSAATALLRLHCALIV